MGKADGEFFRWRGGCRDLASASVTRHEGGAVVDASDANGAAYAADDMVLCGWAEFISARDLNS